MKHLRKCPRCGSRESARSRRRLLERLLFPLKPYRCSGCQRRFFSFVSSRHLQH